MKIVTIYILSLIALSSCNRQQSQKNIDNDTTAHEQSKTANSQTAREVIPDCSMFVFDNARQRADTVLKYTDKRQIKDDIKFFCAFPNTFQEMQELFGYDPKLGAAPLYAYPEGKNMITYFASLTTIPDDTYYKKFINICIGGVWEADNITEAFGLASRLENDTEAVCRILSQHGDQDVRSVFRFIMDGPHPKNQYNDSLQSTLAPLIANENPKLAKLFREAYQELIARDSVHVH